MLNILILIVVMVLVGLIIGALAGPIWKDKRPIGVRGDYMAAVISAVAIGLLDWYVIPAMGFSNTMRYLGVAIEPAAGALLVLWLFRVARR
jgi:uncharacterized membrane protein YeaQ/YmgE (transglycosylase-associated protein family)